MRMHYDSSENDSIDTDPDVRARIAKRYELSSGDFPGSYGTDEGDAEEVRLEEPVDQDSYVDFLAGFNVSGAGLQSRIPSSSESSHGRNAEYDPDPFILAADWDSGDDLAGVGASGARGDCDLSSDGDAHSIVLSDCDGDGDRDRDIGRIGDYDSESGRESDAGDDDLGWLSTPSEISS